MRRRSSERAGRRWPRTVLVGIAVLLIIVVLSFLAVPAYKMQARLPVPAEPGVLEAPWMAQTNGALASTAVKLTNLDGRGDRPAVAWQTWMQDAQDAKATPVEPLLPNASYRLNLLLTPSVISVPGIARTLPSEAAQLALVAAAQTESTTSLRAVVLTDGSRLLPQEGEATDKEFSVDLRRILGGDADFVPDDASALDALGSAYGTVSFELRTGAQEGWTRTAILLLKNNRAIDQIITAHCIGTCTEPRPAGRVPGSERLAALLQDSPGADVALFLTELEERRLHGVLVAQQPIDGRTTWIWNTTRSGEGFRDYLQTTVIDVFDALDTRERLLEKGSGLADFVFPPTPAADAAREVLAGLADRSSGWRPGDAQPPLSLFVHFDFARGDERMTIVPIGLMTYRRADGSSDFIGHAMAVEQPMNRPSYSQSAECAARWVALLPNESTRDDSLELARATLQHFRTTWPPQPGFESTSDIDTFRDWVRNRRFVERTVIATLSHHATNRLFLTRAGKQLMSSEVRSSFAAPSVVVLNGCGTGQPGAMDFVTRFNTQGVESAIVSTFDVHSAVAGTYLSCLRQAIGRADGDSMRLAEAHFRAVNRCEWPGQHPPPLSLKNRLDQLSTETYAANALKYALIGNGDLMICR